MIHVLGAEAYSHSTLRKTYYYNIYKNYTLSIRSIKRDLVINSLKNRLYLVPRHQQNEIWKQASKQIQSWIQ